MGVFGRKAAAADGEPVEFDRERAVPVTNVQNLQSNLVAVAAKMDWPDRSVQSPAVRADLKPGTDTYGKQAVGVWIGKTCVGYLGGPASRENRATRAAVVFELHGAALTAWASPDV